MMHRFFIDEQEIVDNRVLITGGDAHHIHKVLRLAKGAEIFLCDGKGKEYRATIISVNKGIVEAMIVGEIQRFTEPSCKVTLYQGVPKSDKMDWIVQKCVELGIYRIVPVLMERCVVRLETKKDRMKKRDRWQKIAEEAAKQSGRLRIPPVEEPIPLSEALKGMSDHSLILVPWEEEKEQGIKSVLSAHKDPQAIAYMIGPEGGMTAYEAEQLRIQGGIHVTLGRRILRTETAGIAVLSMILFHMDEMGG
ncbi:MAG: 16S rRNA (uracil(1498)-N(3))-methyltransferase [Clostridia bacterium]|jgi:16S rRNA (uracil1498-N3)-methyltransferase